MGITMYDLENYTKAKNFVDEFHKLFKDSLHKEFERLKAEKKIDEFVILMELAFPENTSEYTRIENCHDFLIKQFSVSVVKKLHQTCVKIFNKMWEIMLGIQDQYYKEKSFSKYDDYFETLTGISYDEFVSLKDELIIIGYVLYKKGE